MSIYFTLLQSQRNSLINPRSRWSSNPIPFIKCPLLFLIRFKVVSGLKRLYGRNWICLNNVFLEAVHIRCLDLIRRQVSKVRYSGCTGVIITRSSSYPGNFDQILLLLSPLPHTHTIRIRYSEPGAITHHWFSRTAVFFCQHCHSMKVRTRNS